MVNGFLYACCVLGNPEETAARAQASDQDGDIKRVSTKDWARSTGYDPVKLFNKVRIVESTRFLFTRSNSSKVVSCFVVYVGHLV